MTKRSIDDVTPTAGGNGGSNKMAKLDLLPKGEDILAAMLQRHRMGQQATKKAVEGDVGVRPKNKAFDAAWKELKEEKGFIVEASGRNFKLSEEAIAYKSQDESLPVFKIATTNEEHHEQMFEQWEKQNIKKSSMKTGKKIFEHLLKNPDNLYTKKELAEKLGTKEGSHAFFYGMKKLVHEGYVEVSADKRNKKLRLSDKAFPLGRPAAKSKSEETPDVVKSERGVVKSEPDVVKSEQEDEQIEDETEALNKDLAVKYEEQESGDFKEGSDSGSSENADVKQEA